ncbi:MAG: nucleoside deaminase [Alphaproteobacteria bacterium]|jgi:tRNA(Arg) A34 adenosine deaminase TadA|nr:nucleoside deaminase [Alphaproteobacteria bacterium]
MEPTDFMRRAIDLCQRKMDEGVGGYCATIVVKDGEVIGEGWNDVLNNSDPTGHCEIHALRRAGKKLGTWNLSGCQLYTTWEPCQMCAGAIWWARIERVYYANSLKDAESLGIDISDLQREVSAPTHGRSRPYERLMGEEALAVVTRWIEETNPEGM